MYHQSYDVQTKVNFTVNKLLPDSEWFALIVLIESVSD